MKRIQFCLVLLTLAALVACTGDAVNGQPGVLRIGSIPDQEPTALQRKFEPFAEYLEKELEQVGVEVKYFPSTDYAAAVEALAAGKLDLVWLGGYTSVQAVRQSGGDAIRLAMREEDKKFNSVFVARPDSGIGKLEDLKGRSFTFGSHGSTSGHLMPRHFLAEAGVVPERDFKAKPGFSGAHDATAMAVEAGSVDAGALNFKVWERLTDGDTENGEVDTSKVAVFWRTPDYVDYCWVAGTSLGPYMRKQIQAALLKLDYSKPEHKRVLDLHGASRYVAADDAAWKGIEDAARAAGMLQD